MGRDDAQPARARAPAAPAGPLRRAVLRRRRAGDRARPAAPPPGRRWTRPGWGWCGGLRARPPDLFFAWGERAPDSIYMGVLALGSAAGVPGAAVQRRARRRGGRRRRDVLPVGGHLRRLLLRPGGHGLPGGAGARDVRGHARRDRSRRRGHEPLAEHRRAGDRLRRGGAPAQRTHRARCCGASAPPRAPTPSPGCATAWPSRRPSRRRPRGPERHGTPYALLLADLDRLKEINDRFGHQAGDEAICDVSDALRGAAAARGLRGAHRRGRVRRAAARDHREEGARQLGERLAHHLCERGPAERALGLSYGVAVPGRDGETLDELMRAADQALYTAKPSASAAGQPRQCARRRAAASLRLRRRPAARRYRTSTAAPPPGSR